MKEQSFIEISPAKDKKVCSNCIHFDKWGVHTGYCLLRKKDMKDSQRCRTKFEIKPEKGTI